MNYDNTKCHKKFGLHPLSRRHNFGKITEGSQIDPLSACLGLPTCKELYLISVDANTVKPTAQD